MRLYVAAPLFTEPGRAFNLVLARALEADGHDVYLPQRDTAPEEGIGRTTTIFSRASPLWRRRKRSWPSATALRSTTAPPGRSAMRMGGTSRFLGCGPTRGSCSGQMNASSRRRSTSSLTRFDMPSGRESRYVDHVELCNWAPRSNDGKLGPVRARVQLMLMVALMPEILGREIYFWRQWWLGKSQWSVWKRWPGEGIGPGLVWVRHPMPHECVTRRRRC